MEQLRNYCNNWRMLVKSTSKYKILYYQAYKTYSHRINKNQGINLLFRTYREIMSNIINLMVKMIKYWISNKYNNNLINLRTWVKHFAIKNKTV